ncbi:Cytochrome c552 [Roseibium album]|nr:Cytochrome c552 [Roseibium album]
MANASICRDLSPFRGALLKQLARTLFILFALGSAGAAQAADPAFGKDLALQWCSSCHLVSEDQRTASSASTPSFFDIARDPEWNQEKLATFLINPHPPMPDMSLKTIEIANLTAYIASLKN